MPTRRPTPPAPRDQLVAHSAGTNESAERMIDRIVRHLRQFTEESTTTINQTIIEVEGDFQAQIDVINSTLTTIQTDIDNINTAIGGLITEVIAGTNLTGGGTSGAVTLSVIDSPSFAGNVTLGDASADSHTVNGAITAITGTALLGAPAGNSITATMGATFMDEWSPAGLANAAIVRVTSATGFTYVSGINSTGIPNGRLLWVINTSGQTILFLHQHAGFLGPVPAASRLNVYGATGDYIDGTGAICFAYQTGVGWCEVARLSSQFNGITNQSTLAQLGGATFYAGASFLAGVTIGDAITDASSLTGTLALNGTAGTNGQIAYIDGANGPKWGAPSSAGITTGAGTINRVAKWTGATTLGDSTITDDGATVTVEATTFRVGAPGRVESTAAIPMQLTQTGTAAFRIAKTNTGGLRIAGGSNEILELAGISGITTLNLGPGGSELSLTTTLGTFSGDLRVNGNSGFGVAPGTAQRVLVSATNQNQLRVNDTGAQSSNTTQKAIEVDATGSVPNDLTARTRYGIYVNQTPTRGAGELNGDVYAYAAYLNASTSGLTGTATNEVAWALYCDRGDVELNATDGETVIHGATTINSNTTINASLSALDTTISGTLSVTGNATLGNSTTVDSHTINGSLALTSGISGTALTSTYNAAGATAANGGAIRAANTAGYNTTGGALNTFGVFATVTATRTSGANNLTNIALFGTASGGQINEALRTDDGNVVLNRVSGTTTISGATTINNTLSVTGNATIGDAAGDAHTINGSATITNGLSVTGGNVTISNNLTVNGGAILGDSAASDAHTIRGVNSFIHTAAASAAGLTSNQFTANGTYNTTAGALTTTAISIAQSSTRSAGANNLTARALYVDANGAQVNQAIYTDRGDNTFNAGGGTSTFAGNFVQNSGSTFTVGSNATFTGNLSVQGNLTAGDASTDTHTLNGNLTLSNTPTAGPIKYGSLNARLFLGRQVLSSTSASTYTPSTGTKAVLLRQVGGGGGGGSNYTLGASSISGGGAGGAFLEKWIDTAATVTGGSYQCGAAGAAGNNSGGGTGGDTTIVINGITYTAKGGTGGVGALWTAGYAASGAKQSGTGASSGSVDYFHQDAGTYGWAQASGGGVGHLAMSGKGGDSPWGRGGAAKVNNINTRETGNDGQGYGAGGGGMIDGVAAGGTIVLGGAGTQGLIIVEEYA